MGLRVLVLRSKVWILAKTVVASVSVYLPKTYIQNM